MVEHLLRRCLKRLRLIDTSRTNHTKSSMRSSIVLIGMLASFTLLLTSLTLLNPIPASALSGGQWFMTDTHVHTSLSADASADVGIISRAKLLGYNALFLSDHNGGSSFAVSNLTANSTSFNDEYTTRWSQYEYGSFSPSPTNALVSSPVIKGTKSLHLSSSSSSTGEVGIYYKRGPSFRSGNAILKVSIYPTRIDAGSGVYVAASIGGDPRVVRNPIGYTTQPGVISPGKTIVLVWQLGNARTPSSDANTRVYTYPLGSTYNLNAWNTYTINISDAIAAIPAAERPVDSAGYSYIKMATAANGGTVNAYFDDFSLTASAPEEPAAEYVHRTSYASNYDTSTFKMFPAYEMGQTEHTQRFNFGITSTSQYRTYSKGSAGIAEAQQSGYPTQANHPGVTMSVADMIANKANGADLLEAREQTWIDAWDGILKQGTQIIGIWSSDAHEGLSTGRATTYIYARAVDFDDLLHSLFEGRNFNAANNFSGRVIF